LARITASEAQRIARIAASKGMKPTGATARKARSGRVRRDAVAPADEIRMTIPWAPQPKERARTFLPQEEIERAFVRARGSLEYFKKLMTEIRYRTVTPKETKRFESDVAVLATALMRGRQPFDVPVEMRVRFVFEGDPAEWPVAHDDGDLDNCLKSLKDAFNKVIYTDDRLVVVQPLIKECGTKPRIEVLIRPAPSDSAVLLDHGQQAA
jgi:Holliday junction resolvase RusA-like endonuclease